LILADIPYSFNQTICMHNDKESWEDEKLSHMMQAIKMVTTSKSWRIIINHSQDQNEAVKKVLP
jgi:hypothetical protein